VFGPWDLATIGLIDDWEFCTRTFHAWDPHQGTSKVTSFSHQGLLAAEIEGGGVFNAEAVMKKVLARDRPPLVGIFEFQIGGFIQPAWGVEGRRLALMAVKKVLEEKTEKRLHAIVAEGWGWSDVVVICFGSSYLDIMSTFFSLSELTIGNALELTGWDGKVDIESRTPLKDISEALKKRGEACSFNANHIFSLAVDRLGFDLEAFRRDLTGSVIDRISADDDFLIPYSVLAPRCGHLKAAENAVTEAIGNRTFMSLSSGGERLRVQYCELGNRTSSREFVSGLIGLHFSENLHRHVRRIRTRVTLDMKRLEPIKGLEPKDVPDSHVYLSPWKEQLLISMDRFRALDEACRKLGVAKALTERLSRALSNYNCDVEDISVFTNFLELRPALFRLCGTLGDWSADPDRAPSHSYIQEILQTWAAGYEQAQRNRVYGSYRMRQITDWNPEYRRGIQQLVKALDGLYKVSCEIMGVPAGFSSVGGTVAVKASQMFLHVNPLFAFQPESVCAVKDHELIHHLDSVADRVKMAMKSMPSQRSALLSTGRENLYGLACQLFCDLGAFYMSFGGLREIFSHMYLYCFLSDPDVWKKANTAYRHAVQMFLARVAVVLNVVYGDDRGLGTNEWGTFQRPQNWDDGLVASAEKEAKLAFALWPELKRELDSWKNEMEGTIAGVWGAKGAEEAQHQLRVELRKTLKKLDEGKVVEYQANEMNVFRFTQLVSVSYLELIRRSFTTGFVRWVRRDNEGKVLDADPENESELLADPRGGSYVRGAKARRKYLRWRSAFLLSLWDCSMKRIGLEYRDTLSSSFDDIPFDTSHIPHDSPADVD
jgi:hypothetical protein